MRKGVSLVHMLLFLVDDLRVTSIHDALDKVSGVIYLCKLVSVFYRRITLLDLVFSLELNHLPALTDEIESSTHLLDGLSLVLLEALEVDEANILDGALHWHVDRCCHLRQDR